MTQYDALPRLCLSTQTVCKLDSAHAASKRATCSKAARVPHDTLPPPAARVRFNDSDSDSILVL
eukprot:8344142-Alexandrium_andersonii.AAC.1